MELFWERLRENGSIPIYCPKVEDMYAEVEKIISDMNYSPTAFYPRDVLPTLIPRLLQMFGMVWGRSDSFDVRRARLGLMGVDFGVAETGSLVLFTSNTVERLLSCLPEVFVGVVYTSRLLPDLASTLGYVSQALKGGRCVSIITGPSQTADIEQRFVRGVHGPRQVYVLVVEGGPAIQ